MKNLKQSSKQPCNDVKIRDLSDVKDAEKYKMQKDHFGFMKEAFYYAHQYYDKELFSTATSRLEHKADQSFTLTESLYFSRTALMICSLMDQDISQWEVGAMDNISVRWALYHRSILAFIYHELAGFQSQEIYRKLTG